MNKPLTIIAKVVANKDKLALVKDELLKLVKVTREEEGCLNCVLHQDISEPHIFMFYESWTTDDLWQKHMSSPNLEAYKKATEGWIEELTLNKLVKL
jgi:quinol monooxygenase YgiN